MEQQRFGSLDGWRGICALLVAFYHANMATHLYRLPFVHDAWLFVDFFFVLSGFVISHAYLERLGGWAEGWRFVLRRLGRLWPLHVAVLVPMVGIELAKLALIRADALAVHHPAFDGPTNSLAAILTNLLMIHALGIHPTVTWNFPSWSISTEFYTYIVFALVFSAARGQLSRLALPCAVAAFGAAVVFWAPKYQGFNVMNDYGFFRCLYGFFLGHLVYRLWRTGWLRPLLARRWPAEAAALALAVTYVTFADYRAWPLAAPLVFGLVVLVFAHERGLLSRLLKSRPVASLGAWSYSIYMVHMLVLELINRGLKFSERFTDVPTTTMMPVPWQSQPVEVIALGGPWTMDGFAALYLIAVVALAALSYPLVEQPGRRLFNGLAGIRPRVAASRQQTALLPGMLRPGAQRAATH